MFKKITLLILVAITVAATVFWFNREAWLSEFNNERQQQKKEYRAKGTEFGRANNQQACLDSALEQFDGCTGFSCTVNHGIYLKSCLNEAKPSETFCEGVPEYREEPTEDDKSWAKYYCWDRNIRGEGCRLLMKQQQFFCSQ